MFLKDTSKHKQEDDYIQMLVHYRVAQEDMTFPSREAPLLLEGLYHPYLVYGVAQRSQAVTWHAGRILFTNRVAGKSRDELSPNDFRQGMILFPTKFRLQLRVGVTLRLHTTGSGELYL